MQGSNGDTDEQLLHKQLESLSNIYDRFQPILLKSLPSICLNELHNGHVNIVRYANRYFNCVEIDPVDMWGTIRKIVVDKYWKGIMLLIKLCLCAPFSNATLERFFSFIKFIKWDRRSRLSLRSLNSNLNIRLLAYRLSEFAEKYVDMYRWLVQQKRSKIKSPKRKEYKKRESKFKEMFSRNALSALQPPTITAINQDIIHHKTAT